MQQARAYFLFQFQICGYKDQTKFLVSWFAESTGLSLPFFIALILLFSESTGLHLSFFIALVLLFLLSTEIKQVSHFSWFLNLTVFHFYIMIVVALHTNTHILNDWISPTSHWCITKSDLCFEWFLQLLVFSRFCEFDHVLYHLHTWLK